MSAGERPRQNFGHRRRPIRRTVSWSGSVVGPWAWSPSRSRRCPWTPRSWTSLCSRLSGDWGCSMTAAI